MNVELFIKGLCIMGNFEQDAVGLIVLLIVVVGLLYIYYSRTNAVEKNGYGALIMLSIVSLMIPVFWIFEGPRQASASVTQFNASIQRGMVVYANNCTYDCYGIVVSKDGTPQVATPMYNGFAFNELNTMLDPQVTRIISAGEFKTGTANMPSDNAIPRSDQYGGALLANDVTDLLNFIHSDSPAFLQKNGYTHNQLNDLAAYLQGSAPTQYAAAITFAKNGQFGAPIDKTNESNITIDIVDPGQEGTNCPSTDGCFTPPNVTVKVGTTITWVNKSKVGHTVTATDGQNLASPKAVPQIFSSSPQYPNGLIPTGGTFSYTITTDAYNFNSSTHEIIYYCSVHPAMLAKLTIVPSS
jgi:plastocyanin